MRGAENYVVYNHRVPQLFVEARSYGSGRLQFAPSEVTADGLHGKDSSGTEAQIDNIIIIWLCFLAQLFMIISVGSAVLRWGMVNQK